MNSIIVSVIGNKLGHINKFNCVLAVSFLPDKFMSSDKFKTLPDEHINSLLVVNCPVI